MLATLTDKPQEKGEWIYEVKWDGYRALAFVNEGRVVLKSRNNKDFTEKFYPIKTALASLAFNCVIDGEIVVLNDKGISDFSSLQNWRSESDGSLVFYIFDLLWYNGYRLTDMPLTERKKLLDTVFADLPQGIRISEAFGGPGEKFFEVAKHYGLEGIIAKKTDSKYSPGLRSREWLKIKANKRQEMVIGGYTVNEDTVKPFSSLLVGVYDHRKLQYTGKVGTGFNLDLQKELVSLFKKLKTKTCPFTVVPDVNKPSRFRPNPPTATVTWLKPELVCEVTYAEITPDGVMRHPSFVALREDKNAEEVVLEKPTPATAKTKGEETLGLKRQVSARKTIVNPTEETQVKTINGHSLKFTNLSKVFWPEEQVTKRDVLNYYYQVAPYILPYLKNRPQSLNRHPHGIYGNSFYQKDVTGKAPPWIRTYLYHSNADHRDKHFLVCTNEASLLYMASLGCIELNPWSSTISKPDHPDWCIIDLDPAENTFDQVVEAAQVTHEILESCAIPSYCKTSGSSGLHIYIPLGAKYSYEESKEFARVIARLVHQQLPKFTSIERIVRNRSGKMYIDFLQNRAQATIAAAYSLRPKPGAPVSMPLHWQEVKKGIAIRDYNIFNAVDRLKKQGDIFAPVNGKDINLQKALKALTEYELNNK
jgi:bifunctional non-homologous end joining protein LigD